MINFLYCNNPLDSKCVEVDYEDEYKACSKFFKTGLFSFEDMQDGKLSLYRCDIKGLTIYRGWMMEPKSYENFYNRLLEKGIVLINNPLEYEKYHLLPNWYNDFIDCTARSFWTIGTDEKDIINILKKFSSSVVVKDYVKSQKHYWNEACFIKDANDIENALKVINRFVYLQGESFLGGIVLREFLNLKSLGVHKDSKMPISQEYRVFILNQKPLIIGSYWDKAGDEITPDEKNWIRNLCKKMKSNFVTMDLARLEDGGLCIMELGDGQVSGLQDITADDFYNCFKN